MHSNSKLQAFQYFFRELMGKHVSLNFACKCRKSLLVLRDFSSCQSRSGLGLGVGRGGLGGGVGLSRSLAPWALALPWSLDLLPAPHLALHPLVCLRSGLGFGRGLVRGGVGFLSPCNRCLGDFAP